MSEDEKKKEIKFPFKCNETVKHIARIEGKRTHAIRELLDAILEAQMSMPDLWETIRDEHPELVDSLGLKELTYCRLTNTISLSISSLMKRERLRRRMEQSDGDE